MLLLCSTFVLVASCPTKAQAVYHIDVNTYTWDHPTISISILPPENEQWWDQSYLNATLRAIAQWNDAIQQFASNYTDFTYLSGVSLVPTINHQNVSGFDIYLGWIPECESETTIGQTRARVTSPCTIINSTICLAAKAPSGHVMNEVDLQNIVVHELGHNFALSHSNHSGDVMYSKVYYRKTVKPLSTLDLYAVSQTFRWLSTSTQFNSSACPQESQLTLPANLSYIHLEIADENLPVYPPLAFVEYAAELFLRTETLIVILVAVVLIAPILVIVMRRKKPQ
ncbi:MAG: hypothetical protein CW691_08020 [Candidatus Bathyarchaeum sp.]|nr:MAG: hypothetical protein CW691_08020 [Candidatus Bathyarchaeum sp.]